MFNSKYYIMNNIIKNTLIYLLSLSFIKSGNFTSLVTISLNVLNGFLPSVQT